MKKLDLVNGEAKTRDFLGVEKDALLILDKLIKNKELCKLLFFNTPDALDKELSDEECAQLVEKGYINIRSYFPEGEYIKNFIMISFDNFLVTSNPQFMDYNIEVSIFCHNDNFNFKHNGVSHVRDLYLSHLVVKELINTKLSGIGKVEFMGASSILLGSNPKYSGRSLTFRNVNSLPQNTREQQIIDNNSDGWTI